jgi:hypothetical protein
MCNLIMTTTDKIEKGQDTYTKKELDCHHDAG